MRERERGREGESERKKERGPKSLSVAEQFTPGVVFNDSLKAVDCVLNSFIYFFCEALSTLKHT